MLTWTLARRFRNQSGRGGFLSFISASSTVGIVLGCAVLIAALSMMNGFQAALQNQLLRVIPHVEYQRVEGTFDDWRAIAAIARQDPAVTDVRPVIRQTAMVQAGSEFKGVILQGLAARGGTGGVYDFIDRAALARLYQQPNGVILGKGLAQELGVAIGESITLLIAQADERAFQAPKRQRLAVVGYFEFGGEVDHQTAYTSLTTARDLAGLEAGVTGIQLSVDNIFVADQIAQRVGNQLPELVYVNHWMRTHGHLYRDIELVRTVIYLVLVLVMAVACFNIVSTLVLTVTKKQSQIAMLKTMGLSDTRIILTFVWQGLQNGIIGMFWGAVFGTLLAWSLPDIMAFFETLLSVQILNDDIYFVSRIPSQLHWRDVALVTGVAFAMSFLATLYPAWRATRVQPARALHGNY